jgi:hypothetical protein
MSSRTLLPSLLALAGGVLLGFLLSGLLGRDPIRFEPDGVQPAPTPPSLAPVLERLERVESALRELRPSAPAAPAADPSSPLNPPPADPSASSRVPLAVPAEGLPVDEQLASLEAAIVALRHAVEEQTPTARFPTIDMLRRAPAEQNQQALLQLQALGWQAALKRVQWLTQDEVLQTYGRPNDINWNGVRWSYLPGGVTFEFVQDYVVRVEVH